MAISLIDRSVVRRLLEMRLDNITNVRWDYAGRAEVAEEGGITGSLIGLRLDRNLLSAEQTSTATVSVIVELVCDAEATEHSLYAMESAVQQVVALLAYVEVRDGTSTHTIAVYQAVDEVDYGTDEHEGIIVGRVAITGFLKRDGGETAEAHEPDSP